MYPHFQERMGVGKLVGDWFYPLDPTSALLQGLGSLDRVLHLQIRLLYHFSPE